MATIELTESVLRALAVGIDRLNDGDLDDRKASDEAQKALVTRAGLLASNGRYYPSSQATSGYVLGSKQLTKNLLKPTHHSSSAFSTISA